MSFRQRARGTAVVTGAAGGMGSETARQLAQAGWHRLLLCDIDEARLEAVADPLRAKGAKVKVLVGDIVDPAFPGKLLKALRTRKIGALVHTAGIAPGMAAAERILAVNLDATVRLVDALRPRMTQGSAAVLFASNSSYFPMPPDAEAAFRAPLPPEGTAALAHFAPTPELAYPLSKIGVRALVQREAKAFAERCARIVSVSPGVIDTPMTQGELSNNPVVAQMTQGSALGRKGTPEELAAVCVFLCSPGASFVTAVDWLVDGGQAAAMGY